MMSPRLPRTLISHARRARRFRVPVVVAAVACAATIATAATPLVQGAQDEAAQREASRSWSPFLGDERPSGVIDTRRVVVRFDDPSLGEWVAAGGTRTATQRAAWLRRASKLQQQRLDALSLAGVRFTVEHRYLRVLNGASIVVHGDGAQLLQSMNKVATVTPVRTLWPAAIDDSGAAGAAAAVGDTAGAGTSRAVRVAVLDTGVDQRHPAVAGHVLAPRDATAPSARPSAAAGAAAAAGATILPDPHGTAVAGAVLSGAGDGVDVRLLPIQVLGSRPARDGVEAVMGDSDDLLAALELAVDPDAKPGTDDAVDVAVVASTSPYAGFAGSPEDAAVQAATALGTLVVAAAGNDGASGDAVGTIGSVASSRAALAVGAADLRDTVAAADVHVRGDGVDERFDGAALLTTDAALPGGEHAIVVVDARGDDVVDYLDEQLRSRVTGAVALVATREDVSVASQVRAAADAGAVAVLVGADAAEVAAGTIDVRGADIPAVAIDRSDARDLRDALADGRALAISFATARIDIPAFGTVAGFSSGGPRLDGSGRPDAVAPGVGMLVAGADGTWRHASGTSVAAGWAAGQAAALAARGDLDPARLRSLLLGTGTLLGSAGDRPATSLQGAGVLDPARAHDAGWYVDGGRIDFGSVAPGARARLALGLQSRAGEPRPDELRILLDDGGHGSPVVPTLDGGDLVLDVAADADEGHVGGWLLLPDQGLKVPWSATVRDAAAQRVAIDAELSDRTLRQAAGPGAFAGTLQLSIGGSGASDGSLGLAAIERLEVRLIDKAGKDRGVVGGLHQALPGIYTFGLTGVDPAGDRLAPGAWQLKVRYVPASDPDGAWREGPTATFAMAPRPKPKPAAN